MISAKGYTFTKGRTSHGPNMYISRFGRVVKVIPCSSQVDLSDTYTRELINQIESKD